MHSIFTLTAQASQASQTSESPLVPTRPIDEVLPPPFLLWWQWALLIITVLFVTTIIILLSRQLKKRKPQLHTESPLQIAEQQIDALSKQSLTNKQFPINISIILREYILRRFNGHTLFQTQEETNAEHLQTLDISDNIKQESLDFLNQLDKLKYDRTAPDLSQPEIANSLKMLLIRLDREYLTNQRTP